MRIVTTDDPGYPGWARAVLGAITRQLVSDASAQRPERAETGMRALAEGGQVVLVLIAATPDAIAAAGHAAPAVAEPAEGAPDERTTVALTRRQTQVLALMAQGKPNKLICRALNLSEGTVKVHVSAVLRALKASNRTAAVVAASALRVEEREGPAGKHVSPHGVRSPAPAQKKCPRG